MQDFSDQIVDLIATSTSEAPRSWAAVERGVGAQLPDDYKRLIDRVGPVIIDEWLCLFGPDNGNPSADIEKLIGERDRAWTKFRESGVALPERYFINGGRLIAFGAVESNYFYWRSRPGVLSGGWGVTIVDADLEEWYDFDFSATECVYKIMVGEIELDPFEDLFGGGEHVAEPFPG